MEEGPGELARLGLGEVVDVELTLERSVIVVPEVPANCVGEIGGFFIDLEGRSRVCPEHNCVFLSLDHVVEHSDELPVLLLLL